MLTLIVTSVLGAFLIMGTKKLIEIAEEQYQSYIFWGA